MRIKSITSLLIAICLMFTLTIPAFGAVSSAENSIEKSGAKTVTIQNVERLYILKDQNGKQLGATYWQYTADTGITGPAYCIAHGLKSVPAGTSLPIKDRYESSPKTMGAFASGYPQVPLAEFITLHGTTGLTESEYGYATQLAMWATLGQLGVEGTAFTQGREQVKDPGSSDAQQSRVFKALQAILAGANTWTKNQYRGMFSRYRENEIGDTLELYTTNGLAGLVASGDISTATINSKEYYVIPWYVASATPTKPHGDIIDVTPYFAPTGTILVDINNVPLANTIKGDGTASYKVPTEKRNTNLNANGVEYLGKFKIAIPTDATIPLSGSIDLVSYTEMTQYEMFVAYNAKNTEQSYMIADPAVGPTYGKGVFKWSSEEIEETEARLEVSKTGGMGEPLAGATFELRDADTVVDTQTTGENGKAVFENLDVSTQYTLVETVAPAGYVIAAPVNVTLQSNVTTYVTVPNENAKKFRVRKIDKQDGLVLQGATFAFEQIDDGFYTDGITEFDGVIEFNGQELPFGSYKVWELTPPDGYLIDTTVKTVEWTGEADVELIFADVRIPGIVLNKVDQDGKPLADAVFDVFKDSQRIDSVTTTETGSVRINCGLGEGYYEVQEISAPTGYELDSTKHGVYLDPYDPAVENDPVITVINDKKPGLYILKVDEDTGEPLANAEFSVEKNGGQIIYQGLTDETGTITLENLDPGWYTIRELAAPHGYLIRDEHKDVLLEVGKVVQVKFDNRRRPALEILKVDTVTGKPLECAKFTVTKTEDKTVSEYITDSGGRIFIENLDEAVYTVEEITAPEGYILETQHKEIALEWGKTKTLIYENTRKPTLIITKLNGLTNLPVAGATYKVEYEAANGGMVTLGSYQTDANGQIVIPKVNAGWYKVTETQPAPGFSLPSNPMSWLYLAPGQNAYLSEGISTGTEQGSYDGDFNLLSGSDFTPTLGGNGELVYNWPLNSIVIKKTNAVTGELLAGATFELYRADEQVSGVPGTNVGRFTTDNSGIIVITGLQPGYYVVKETIAPPYFLISENNMQNGFLKADGTTVLEFSFANNPYGGILISKVDTVTNMPLPNARFKVTDSSGAVVGNTNGEYITDANGEIMITGIAPGAYVITELEAPEYYVVDTTPQTIHVDTDGKVYKVSFKNQPSGTLVITKKDTVSNEPLAGAEFFVTHSDGSVVGTGNGYYTTDASGTITIPHLEKGSYIVRESKAPVDYVLENQTKTIAIDYGKTYNLEFFNRHMSGLQIIKVDKQTKQPLKDAEFAVYKQSGEMVDRYVTDADGVIIIDTLAPGWYKAVETKAPDGYLLDDTPKDFQIIADQFIKLVFEDAPLSGLIIRKVDADTRDPLEGAEFTVKEINGRIIGVYRSGTDGLANVGVLSPGWYTVTETKAPDNYTLGDNVQTVEIKHTELVVLEFQNRAFGSLVIKKIDEITSKSLAGADFEVHEQSGAFVGNYTTGVDGTVNIPNLAPGWYVISETKAPTGYTLDNTAKTIEVKPVTPSVVTFTNKPLSGIEIIKLDASTKAPLTGATFLVERSNGERIGSYKTDSTGKILVSGLEEGVYIISETDAPDGYILDEVPKTVTVTSGKLTIVEFFNKPLSGLKIIKLDSVTRNTIEGAEFTITKMSGESVNNSFNGTIFKTDRVGQIYIPQLEDGYYIVTETKAADGYMLDGEPKTVLVESRKSTVLEVFNTPQSGLLIVKTDANTGEPLQGVVFDVRRADGQLVSGLLNDGNQPNTEVNSPNKTTSPNGDIAGSYTTDSNGRILINYLPAGEYHITERKQLDGYELDTDVHAATVVPGKLTTLQLTNKQKAGLRLLKIDSITKKGIYNVEFMVFDSNNNVVGNFYTDDQGVIDFCGILPEGRYTIRETRPAANYYPDDIPRTVEFVAGKITEIVWENTPRMGQVQILKKSGDNNEVNGLPAGTPLAGAVFEAYDYKTGNLVDRFVSGNDGRAVSAPLPLGRYLIKEVQAPQWYKLSTQQLDIEVEFATQIIKLEYLNYAANTGVYIKKTGNLEAMPGDTIRYDIKAVQNTSTVPLTDFFWRDVLPTDAVRLNKIVTGTYSQSLKYKIIATSNKGDTFLIADNLSSTKNNVIDCSNASLGLRSDEYVTSFSLVFGNVKPGFAHVLTPQIYVTVLKTLPNGYQFANKCDVGGKYGTEWVVANSTCVTTIYSNSKLPRTGY